MTARPSDSVADDVMIGHVQVLRQLMCDVDDEAEAALIVAIDLMIAALEATPGPPTSAQLALIVRDVMQANFTAGTIEMSGKIAMAVTAALTPRREQGEGS